MSHGSLLSLIEWHSRRLYQMITKMHHEVINSFESKSECIRYHYIYTHELFKRLIWAGVVPVLRTGKLTVLSQLSIQALNCIPLNS